MRLHVTTKLAIQAAIAVALAAIIGHYFAETHTYWAMLVAMFVLSQSWAESIKKSLQRIGMTVCGAVVGSLLFFVVPHVLLWEIVCVLIATFFTVYYLGNSYSWSMFFTTILVVFIFAILHDWTFVLFKARIAETFVGAIIAIITAALVFPIRIEEDVKQTIPDLLTAVEQSITDVFSILIAQQKPKKILIHQSLDLYKLFYQLREKYQLMNYEHLFTKTPRKKIKKIMLNLDIALHYLTSVIEIMPKLENFMLTDELRENLQAMQQIMLINLSCLQQQIEMQRVSDEVSSINDVLTVIQNESCNLLRQNCDKGDWINFYAVIFYLKRFNEAIVGFYRENV